MTGKEAMNYQTMTREQRHQQGIRDAQTAIESADEDDPRSLIQSNALRILIEKMKNPYYAE